MLDIVDETVTSSLRANEGSTPSETLSGEHASEFILEPAVGTEQETNLAGASANVAGYK